MTKKTSLKETTNISYPIHQFRFVRFGEITSYFKTDTQTKQTTARELQGKIQRR
jgi:hypothetical protein